MCLDGTLVLLLWLAVVFRRLFFFLHIFFFFIFGSCFPFLFFRERFVRARAYVHRIFNTSLLIFIQYIISLFLLLLCLLVVVVVVVVRLVIGWLVACISLCHRLYIA